LKKHAPKVAKLAKKILLDIAALIKVEEEMTKEMSTANFGISTIGASNSFLFFNGLKEKAEGWIPVTRQ
jgi:hypothetical protein